MQASSLSVFWDKKIENGKGESHVFWVWVQHAQQATTWQRRVEASERKTEKSQNVRKAYSGFEKKDRKKANTEEEQNDFKSQK